MSENEVNAAAGNGTVVNRVSDLEVAVTRVFDAPARIVYKAWSTAELFARWWVPKSIGMQLRSCEMDVRTGGTYRLEFGADGGSTWAFFGTYTEVVPLSLMVWTNDEGENGAISRVTFREEGGKTHVTFSETYPTKEALEENLGGLEAAAEQFAQLDALLAELAGRD